MTDQVFGVGIIGAGPVAQAIHLPTLQRLADRFRVVHVMDPLPDLAASVASRVAARHSSRVEDVLADPAVDVVAVCSPHRFHAEQAIAACAAGKRAVLCEKPLAMTAADADAVRDASAASGVPVVVGTMHAYDPACRRAFDAWEALGARPHAIRLSTVIPPNTGSEDSATEIVGSRPAPPQSRRTIEQDIHGGIMGLAIHDLPLVRRLAGGVELEVVSAASLAPTGYDILARGGDTLVEIHGTSSGPWELAWVLSADSAAAALRVRFPLPYVHAGSAAATLTTAEGSTRFGPLASNGYVAEWMELHDHATGALPHPDAAPLADDLRFAAALADDATALALRMREPA